MLREAGVPCLVHQLRYNMFNREPEESVFQAIRETGTGCVAFSPLAQGMLTDRYLEGIPADSRAAGSSVFLTEERVREHGEKIRSLAALARSRGQSLAQMALAWVLRDPVVTTAPDRRQPPPASHGLPESPGKYAVHRGGAFHH